MAILGAARKFWADRRGAAAIEFAMIAPVLLLAFTAMVDLGIVVYDQMRMAQIVREAVAAIMAAPGAGGYDAIVAHEVAKVGSPTRGGAFAAGPVLQTFECAGGTAALSANILCADGLEPRIFLSLSVSFTSNPLNPIFPYAHPYTNTARVQVR